MPVAISPLSSSALAVSPRSFQEISAEALAFPHTDGMKYGAVECRACTILFGALELKLASGRLVNKPAM
jgi:hypothetical protein